MQVHRGDHGLLGGPALGEQAGAEAGEHVTHARGGHPRVAGAVDVPAAIRRGDHAAAALEHDAGIESRRQFECRIQAVCLHLGGLAGKQSGGLGRVRRQHGRSGSTGNGAVQA